MQTDELGHGQGIARGRVGAVFLDPGDNVEQVVNDAGGRCGGMDPRQEGEGAAGEGKLGKSCALRPFETAKVLFPLAGGDEQLV